ncbi:MAG: glycosyltransferase family 4 protein [Planctomycetota bacterium]
MNILLVHQYFLRKGQGGGSRWNEFTRIWAERGHQVTVIAGMYCLADGTKYSECVGKLFHREQVSANVEVLRVHTTSRYDKNFVWRAVAYWQMVVFGLLGAVLYAKKRYDVVLASSPPLTVGILGIALSVLKRRPFVFEVRDLWPESAIDTGVLTNPWVIRGMYWMEKVSYRRARAINVLTPAFRKALTARKGIPPERVWMIPNAADLELVKPGPVDEEIRRKHGWGDRFVGIYVGAHGVANRLGQLIDAAKLLRDEPEYLIVLLGNGMEKEALVEAADREGLTNIQFLDTVPKEEVGRYLNAADVSLIVLQKNDTFKTVYPNKMFDSMAAARPIILAIDGAARELVVDAAGCGTFVEPENAEQIVAAMKAYRENPDMVRRHGENGRKYVAEHYDRRVLGARYIALLERAVRQPAAGG